MRIKVQQELNFATLCLHVRKTVKHMRNAIKACEERGKACEESSKACEESGKALCENTSEPPFWKKIFALLKWSTRIQQKPFSKGKPQRPMPISVFSKANVQRFLSKALKAKLSSIPSQIANLSTPDLDQLSRKTSADMPLFDHQPWRQLPQARGPVGGPLSNGMWCVLFVWSFRCSLSLCGGRYVYLWRYGKNLGQILGDYQR